MKKLLTLAAALSFSVTMFAQSSTSSTSGSTQTEDTKNTPQASTSATTSSQTGATDNTTPASKSGASASDRSDKKIKLTGYVEERNGQFFLQTGAGKEVQLQSSEDLTAHVGHKIRAIGNW